LGHYLSLFEKKHLNFFFFKYKRHKTKTITSNQNRTSKNFNNKASLSSLDKIYPDELDTDPLKTVESSSDNFEEIEHLDKPSSSSSSTSESSSSSTNSTSSSSDINTMNINKNDENELESNPNSDSNTSDEIVNNKLDEQINLLQSTNGNG
jgi:hypothetical protein